MDIFRTLLSAGAGASLDRRSASAPRWSAQVICSQMDGAPERHGSGPTVGDQCVAASSSALPRARAASKAALNCNPRAPFWRR